MWRIIRTHGAVQIGTPRPGFSPETHRARRIPLLGLAKRSDGVHLVEGKHELETLIDVRLRLLHVRRNPPVELAERLPERAAWADRARLAPREACRRVEPRLVEGREPTALRKGRVDARETAPRQASLPDQPTSRVSGSCLPTPLPSPDGTVLGIFDPAAHQPGSCLPVIVIGGGASGGTGDPI